MNSRIKKYTLTDGGFSFSLAITAVILANLLYMVASQGKENKFLMITTTLVVELILVVIWYGYGRHRNIDYLAAVKASRKPSLEGLLFCLVAVLALFGLGILIEWGLIWFFDLINYELTELSYNTGQIIYFILVVVIAAPIGEELIFRGVLLNSMTKHGKVLAIIVSAAFFSLFHMSPEQTIYQFLLGILLAYIALRFDNIFLAIIGHAFSNLLAAVRIIVSVYSSGGTVLDITLCIVAFVAGILTAVYLIKKGFIEKKKAEEQEGYRETDVSISKNAPKAARHMVLIAFLPGVGVAIIVWITTFLTAIGVLHA